jgi:hypothetical protein
MCTNQVLGLLLRATTLALVCLLIYNMLWIMNTSAAADANIIGTIQREMIYT